jgi:hypothetical protein
MARDWEAQLRLWAKPPGTAEQERMENAERQIRAAIAASPKLSAHQVSVFAQGSYRNRTHIPRESDVDICVVCEDIYRTDWHFVDQDVPHDEDAIKRWKAEAGLVPAAYGYAEFKNDVAAALVAKFGRAAVARGDKAFDVHETTTRVNSDVVAAYRHRRYKRDIYGRLVFEEGIEFDTDRGEKVINWPQQHYDNGVAKNGRTGDRFKAMVRALKNLAGEMDDTGIPAAKPMKSFLLECLVYNVPDEDVGSSSYRTDMKQVIADAWGATKTDESCSKWVEVNDRKWLFRGKHAWTRGDVHAFLHAAWNYDELGTA